MVQGKLSLREIGSRSFETKFNQQEEWVRSALALAAPHPDLCGMEAPEWAQQSSCSGELRVDRIDPDYSIRGSFEARVPVLCPRCGELATIARSADFTLIAHPVGPRDEVEEGDDPDYIFLETPYLDFVSLLSEQIVAAESVVEHPDQNPDASPHNCSLNTGQIELKAGNSPFEILKKLKV